MIWMAGDVLADSAPERAARTTILSSMKTGNYEVLPVYSFENAMEDYLV
jgi:hypothetical protein